MSGRVASFLRRNSVNISAIIIACAFAGILYFQAVATSKLQRQVEQQQQIIRQISGVTGQINQAAKQRTQQIDQLNRHLDCIVIFFTQPDRANQTITDIDKCTLQNERTGEVNPGLSGLLQQENSSPTVAQSTDGQVATPTPSVAVVPPSTSPSTSPPSPAPAPTPSPTPAPEAPQPSFLDRLLSPVTTPLNNLIKRL